MKPCRVIELGAIGYLEAFAIQQQLVAARKLGAAPDVLLLCEHPHVVTLGRNGQLKNLKASDAVLRQMGVEFHHTNRGGDITYHGPGQVVGYPILQLSEIRRDVGWYVRQLEETMIQACNAFGVDAFRVPRCTGVWVRPSAPTPAGPTLAVPTPDGFVSREEKIGAIGVHLSRWVTSHGFAFNASTDLRYFDLIVPCGISDRSATSLEKLIGRRVSSPEVIPSLIAGFQNAFGLEMIGATAEDLGGWLADLPEPAGVGG